jgi:hypothetical protein
MELAHSKYAQFCGSSSTERELWNTQSNNQGTIRTKPPNARGTEAEDSANIEQPLFRNIAE